MTSVKSFSSRKEFSEAKKRGRNNALRRIQREIEALFSDNRKQDQEILNVLRKVGDKARYRIVYVGGGWVHLQIFVWPCHESSVRRTKEKLSSYKYSRIKIDIITRKKSL
jgi:hypothetical protein